MILRKLLRYAGGLTQTCFTQTGLTISYIRQHRTIYLHSKNTAETGSYRFRLNFCIFPGRIIYNRTVLSETGTVAGAVPCTLGFIPFEGASHVGTSFCGGSEKICRRIQHVDKNPGLFHASLGRKNFLVSVVPAGHHIAENLRSHHRRGHPPFVESCGDVKIGSVF